MRISGVAPAEIGRCCVETTIANLKIRLGADDRFSMIGNANARLADHGQVIGAIANGDAMAGIGAQTDGQQVEEVGLGGGIDDVSEHLAGDLPVDDLQGIGEGVVEVQRFLQVAGKLGEAAGHDTDLHALGLGGCHQFTGTGAEPQALTDDGVDGARWRTGQQTYPLAQGGLKIQLACHGAFGDSGDLAPETKMVGHFINAFNADQGRVHIGQQ